jgi:hypothetical protein
MINLHEILIKHIPTELYDPSLDKYYLAAMKEVCEDVINLCAENAYVEIVDHEELYISSLPGYDRNDDQVILPIYGVDEASILKTKTQII